MRSLPPCPPAGVEEAVQVGQLASESAPRYAFLLRPAASGLPPAISPSAVARRLGGRGTTGTHWQSCATSASDSTCRASRRRAILPYPSRLRRWAHAACQSLTQHGSSQSREPGDLSQPGRRRPVAGNQRPSAAAVGSGASDRAARYPGRRRPGDGAWLDFLSSSCVRGRRTWPATELGKVRHALILEPFVQLASSGYSNHITETRLDREWQLPLKTRTPAARCSRLEPPARNNVSERGAGE